MTVLVHAGVDHVPGGDLQGREERGSSVAFVVVSHRPATPFLERESRLRSVQSPDLALLVATEDHRGFGR